MRYFFAPLALLLLPLIGCGSSQSTTSNQPPKVVYFFPRSTNSQYQGKWTGTFPDARVDFTGEKNGLLFGTAKRNAAAASSSLEGEIYDDARIAFQWFEKGTRWRLEGKMAFSGGNTLSGTLSYTKGTPLGSTFNNTSQPPVNLTLTRQ